MTPIQSHQAVNSFVRPAPRAFFRPDRSFHSRRAQGLSRLAASSRPPEGLGLDRPEHGGMLEGSGTAGRQNLTRHSTCIDNSPRHSTPTKSTTNTQASPMAQAGARKI